MNKTQKKIKWYPFDPAKGSRQKRPPIKKLVLGKITNPNKTDKRDPDPIVVCYRKDAAGDKQSPQFITPGCRGLGEVYEWCDCLPHEDLNDSIIKSELKRILEIEGI
jgi:hypothetical protein